MEGGGGGGVTSINQILSLLSAVKNHQDLAVKLSSLRQAKDILCSFEPSSVVVELFPYIVELQGSNEVLVDGRAWVEALKVMDESSVFMPVFLTYLKDDASSVVRQSIVSGTNFFCGVLEEMALQYHQSGKVERWLEELWSWMVKFKNAICGIAVEAGPISTKLLALKFLETNVLLFTSDANDDETSSNEVKGQNLNSTWVVGGHPILEPDFLTLEANMSLGYLLGMLRSAKTLPGCVTITLISCLAAIARKRPMHYTRILSALLGFDPNFETPRSHAASIKYSLRIAFLGFLKCTHPCIVESRDILVKAADEVIREVDNKIVKNTERASRVVRFNKEDQKSNPFLPVAGELNKKRSMLQDVDSKGNNDELLAKRTRYLPVENAQKYSGDDEVTLMQNESTPVEQMIAMIASLLAEGERGPESLEILISRIQPDLMADIVIANMRHLPKNSPPLSSRLGTMPVSSSLSGPSFTASQKSPVFQSQCVTPSSTSAMSAAPSADLSSASDLSVDLERDPRRFDQRRLAESAAAVKPLPAKEEISESDTEPSQVGFTKPNPEENMDMEDLHLLRSHGTTIIGKHIPLSCVYMAADGREARSVKDVNGKMKVVKEADTTKTEILWDRVLLGGAGDSSWLADIIEELKNVPADYWWTAKDCADYAHFIMKGYYLKDSHYEKLTCHFLFASYTDELELYFASRGGVKKIVDDVECIGTGGKHARKYLKRPLGHQTFAAHVNGLISAVEYASEHDPNTGDRVTVHRVSRDHGVDEQDIPRSDIHLVREVDVPDIQREVSEDTLIHLLTRKARKIQRREAANSREANQN